MELQISTLGDFSISMDGYPVFAYTGRTKKLWNLLEFIIVNRKNEITHADLIRVAQLDSKSGKPENALKNLMYRLRNLLAESQLPPMEYIVCERGVYTWNPEISCTVDAELFEQQWRLASDMQLPEENRQEHYLAAVRLYRGNFLVQSAGEEWVTPLRSYYVRIYRDCIVNLYKILSHRGQYLPLLEICRFATTVDPYSETLHQLHVLTLVRLERHKEALQVYQGFIDRLYKETGTTPSEKMSSLYQEIIRTINHVQADINVVKQDLREANAKRGAYLCPYEIFKNMYRIMARTVERTHQQIHIVLFTVSDQNGDLPTIKQLNSSMRALEENIGSSLRKGDVYSRYSNTQYVVLLQSITYENAQLVAKRILANYSYAYRNRKIVVNYMIQGLEPLEEGQLPQPQSPPSPAENAPL